MKKKNTVACVIMVAAIAGSIPLGINRSLARIREDAAEEYYYDQAGYAIYDGIEERRAAASNLLTLAERYTDQNPELKSLADELEYRVQASENAWSDDDTFTAEAQANANLDAPAQALATALEGVGLSEKDQKYPRQILDQMKSEQDKIKRSSYNDQARSYNEKLDRLQPMALLKPMATFDGPAAAVSAEQTGAESAATADDIANRAEEYADGVADRAEDYADRVAEQAEDYADQIAEEVEDFIDGLFD